MGVKNSIRNIGQKAGNTVAKLSALSPVQVEKIQLQREAYLLEMPNPNDTVAHEQTERIMAASSIEIFNAFLLQLKELYLPVENDSEYDTPFDAGHNIRYFNITKWVTEKNENNLEKLVNVYAVLSNADCNIALVFNRTRYTTNVYLAVVNNKNSNNNVDVDGYKTRLIDAIRGNFPGAEWSSEGFGIIPCLDNDKTYSVATASNIPTEKSEKFISQTIEKLLDGIVPDSKKKEYTIILLATPIQDIEDRKLKLGEFYSGMAPYASWQTDFHYMENTSEGSSATMGVNAGVSAGIQNGQNYSTTDTDSVADQSSQTNTTSNGETITEGNSTSNSESSARSEGTSTTDTTNIGTSGSNATSTTNTSGTSDSFSSAESTSTSFNGGAKLGIVNAGYSNSTSNSITEGTSTMQNIAKGVSQTSGWNNSTSKALGQTATDTLTKGITNTISNSVAKTTSTAVANTLGKAVTTAMATTSGVAKNTSLGANFGASFARSSTVTTMVGKNEGITQTFTNYNIKHTLELLESQMKRLEQSTALGTWDFAAYVLSEDQHVANNVAHSYLALTLGEESYMSKSAINLWRGNIAEEKQQAKEINSYLKQLRHPVFALNPNIIEQEPEFNEYPTIVTATTSLSGKELAYSLNFPQKSIAGLPILECAEFGRNVVTYDERNSSEETIKLGQIFHMNHVEKTEVELSQNSLTSHTFITGSTGAGKSNTIYHMLNASKKKGVKFLVVEPAKGEYKNIFGNDNDVSIYGTNPKLSPLLQLNPFSFPESIHVLEHIDRLIEIFNVCWPMYAAMPAVLKNAVEKAYEDCGWDLLRSANKHHVNIYPEFADIAKNIKIIIDSSEYDNDNKGAYKGSLITRLRSLSNGINGLIFSSDEISNKKMFDENVIVDLSRIGSTETKSLIMGMLVLKLQEYRMASGKMNAPLNHITVLEEAHNILKRTPTAQISEGSNLVGKSVEMLSNAIAEMRTYGEGFIIADQAPELMDMSVIRNTNTKIIMRLPDQSDRELVGKSANLNDDQISELAKLPCGVAAVYQNEWVQPILCKVDKFSPKYDVYNYCLPNDEDIYGSKETLSNSLLKCIMDKELFNQGDKSDLKELKDMILKSRLDSYIKVDFLNYLEDNENDGLKTLGRLVYDFLNAKNAIKSSTQYDDIHDWIESVVNKLEPSINGYSKKQIDLVAALILQEQTTRDLTYQDVYHTFTEIYRNGGGVF